MPQSVFPFVQVEMPFELGVPDGRWMVRARGTSEVQQVIVLSTIRASPPSGPLRRRSRGRQAPEQQSPTVPIARATIVAAQPLPDQDSAQAWLDRIEVEHEIESAFAALNRLLEAQRVAAADPYLHEVAPSQAVSMRAGFGLGEQVAQGQWIQTRPLSVPKPRRWQRGRRTAILRSHERLASLLGSQRGALICEELALRARLDLDHDRLALGAGELQRALTLAIAELEGEVGAEMPARIAELRELLPNVAAVAAELLSAPEGDHAQHAQTLAQALGRLEAALRARAVALAWH